MKPLTGSVIFIEKFESSMQEILNFLQHHWQLTSALIVILLLLMLMEFLKKSKGTNLSPVDTINLINHENAAVIDIRSSDAYLNGHIIGSISIPLHELNDKIKKIEKFKAQPIVIVCATGKDSTQAMRILTGKGFARIYTLQGGIQAWKMNEMPLTKG
jgi:rhodanese-related sulfurtransferase